MTLHRLAGTGLPNVYLKNGFTVEGEGDEQLIAYADLDGLYSALAGVIARRATPLAGVEFKFLRRRLGLSQEQAGAMVEKTNQAIAKWEKGQATVPLADGNMMRLAWLSKYGRRDLGRVVDQMVRANDELRGSYVFAYDGKSWVDDTVRSVFTPMVNFAFQEAAQVIGHAKSTSSEAHEVQLPEGVLYYIEGIT
jgi:DNA-binding transcriptional regulator YiaG